MSRVFADWRGSFARILPGWMALSPASTWRRARTGIVYSRRPFGALDHEGRREVLLARLRDDLLAEARLLVGLLAVGRPVDDVLEADRAAVSAMMTELYGSHEAIVSSFSTVWPSVTATPAP